MPEAFVLRVEQIEVRHNFPYDKVYFFRRRDEKLFPSIFQNALVLPLSKKFTAMIATTTQSHRMVKREYPIKRDGKLAPSDGLDEVLENPNGFLAVIPILFLHHKLVSAIPGYLNGPTAYVGRKAGSVLEYPLPNAIQMRLKRSLSARAYFIRAGEIIKPICGACEKGLDMLQGKCHFGSPQCYYLLGHDAPTDYARNMQQYDKVSAELYEAEVEL
jgi:hypothetical protein